MDEDRLRSELHRLAADSPNLPTVRRRVWEGTTRRTRVRRRWAVGLSAATVAAAAIVVVTVVPNGRGNQTPPAAAPGTTTAASADESAAETSAAESLEPGTDATEWSSLSPEASNEPTYESSMASTLTSFPEAPETTENGGPTTAVGTSDATGTATTVVTTAQDFPVVLLTSDPGAASSGTAELTGLLSVTAGSCPVVNTDDGRLVIVIWPAGTTASLIDGDLRIRNASNVVIGQDGQQVAITGEPADDHPPDPRCAEGTEYWLAG